VASPGESSLKAALNPANSDYLYYVRNPDRDDGAHNFYNNSRDFEAGVQALRNWEHERDLEEQKQK
jgi:cell division protein YceG involved in septum cleavage